MGSASAGAVRIPSAPLARFSASHVRDQGGKVGGIYSHQLSHLRLEERMLEEGGDQSRTWCDKPDIHGMRRIAPCSKNH